MKLLSSLLLLFFAVHAWASPGTWPYEASVLYWAYRLECAYYQPGQTITANGCVGARGPKKPCNMDEFLRYIVKGQWSGSTNLGDAPTVTSAADQIRSSGYNTMKYDAEKVIPSKIIPTHAGIMEQVAKNVKDTLVDIDGFTNNEIDQCLQRLGQARNDALSERQREHAKFKIQFLEGLLGNVFVKGEVTSASGSVYDSINTDASVAKASNDQDKQKIRDAVKTFELGKSGTIADREHQRIINIYEGDLKDSIIRPETCK